MSDPRVPLLRERLAVSPASQPVPMPAEAAYDAEPYDAELYDAEYV
jgi:hypothetical protein